MDEIEEILKDAIITVNGEEVEPNENLKKLMKDPLDPTLPDDTHAMAYTPEEREEVDIDNLIGEIDDDEEIDVDIEISHESITKRNDSEIDLDEKHSLANKIVDNSLDVIKKADKVFTNFSDDVMMGKDRSTSSKEMLIKALEIQNQANKNLIDLARTIDKENSGNTNILIGASVSPKKTGVNPDNIKAHFKKSS